MKPLFPFFFFLLSSILSPAQERARFIQQVENPKFVSIREMKDNFYGWIQGRNNLPRLDSISTLRAKTILIRGELNRKYVFASNDWGALHETGMHTLPPSSWEIKGEGERYKLCWKRSGLGSDSKRYDKLKAQFGEEGEYGIHAKWFTGTIFAAEGYASYCGNLIARSVATLHFVNGETRHSMDLDQLVGSMSREIRFGNLVPPVMRTYSPDRHEGLFLSHDVNRYFSEQPVSKERTFSVLWAEDSEGKSHLHLLIPNDPSEEDTRIFQELEKAIETLPKRSMTYPVTSDGRLFPGRYLKALYSNDDGIMRWTFQDYFFEGKDSIIRSKKPNIPIIKKKAE